jgi:hypothetical protein
MTVGHGYQRGAGFSEPRRPRTRDRKSSAPPASLRGSRGGGVQLTGPTPARPLFNWSGLHDQYLVIIIVVDYVCAAVAAAGLSSQHRGNWEGGKEQAQW